MADQEKFDLWPRTHDLPPRWDGLPVEWGSWRDTEGIFICPPPKPEKCSKCKSTKPPLMNLGRIFTEHGMVRAVSRGKLLNGKHLVANISAFRCPDCNHDYVIDGLDADSQAWDLDPTDYTDEGSRNLEEK